MSVVLLGSGVDRIPSRSGLWVGLPASSFPQLTWRYIGSKTCWIVMACIYQPVGTGHTWDILWCLPALSGHWFITFSTYWALSVYWALFPLGLGLECQSALSGPHSMGWNLDLDQKGYGQALLLLLSSTGSHGRCYWWQLEALARNRTGYSLLGLFLVPWGCPAMDGSSWFPFFWVLQLWSWATATEPGDSGSWLPWLLTTFWLRLEFVIVPAFVFLISALPDQQSLGILFLIYLICKVGVLSVYRA
jgi:hypothetical protein